MSSPLARIRPSGILPPLFLLAFAGPLAGAAPGAPAEEPGGPGAMRDLEAVTRRMVDLWTAGAESPDKLRGDVDALRPDGSWPDVDYAAQNRSGWKTVLHLQRARSMAAAVRASKGEAPGIARLREAAGRALRFWIERDFRNPNWWWNEIGVPMSLGPALLLLGGDVPAELRDRGVRILERAKLGKGTGQNLVWLTEMALVRACIERRPDELGRAFARIAEEVRVTTGEGIQPDFSFHQHGPQLYSGGYGFGFSVDVPRLAALAEGTRFAFPRERIEILTRYLLDGQRWMVRGAVFDHAAVGREITRPGGRRAPALEKACDDLLRIGAPRAEELRAFAAALREPERGVDPISGHRHFWRSDYSVHRRQGYMATVKMSSTRTAGWEIVNSEGLRSHHTASGMNLLYRRGDEYADIFGAWDWVGIPGATVRRSPDAFSGRDTRGASSFAGGATDGEYGAAGMEVGRGGVRGGVRARKAWFFFDREYVCLGAGIGGEGPGRVETTVNQCLLRGGVRTADDAGPETGGEVWWALHDGVGYVVPAAARPSMRLDAGSRTGSWHDGNGSLPDRPVTVDAFRLWIDHGERPEGASYAYAIVPGTDAAALAACRWPVEVTANGPDLQAVRHRELPIAAAVFYRAGRAPLGAGRTVEVDGPAIVLLREVADSIVLAASSPDHREGVLTVRLSMAVTGEGARPDPAGGTSVTIDLPAGPLAGKSSVRRLVAAGRRAAPPVKAFPTAEGFGAGAAGGRGGRVIEVTTLDDAGPGSLRAAMEAPGPRICVFRVSGTITLKSAIRVSEPYLTVAGQTSPGGVQVRGSGQPEGDWGVWCVNGAHDIVLRHLRVRMGGNMKHDAGNNILFYGTAEPGVHDVIVDHCSVSWGSDTQLDWYGSYLDRATFQWNLIGECYMGQHIGGNRAPKNITLHHNLYANLGSRTPLMQHADVFDFRNNVIYNWSGNNASVFGQFALNSSAFGNVVANLWLAGPESGYPYLNVGNGGPVRIDGKPADAGGTKLYLSGNRGPRCPTGCANDWVGHGVNTWDWYEFKHDGSTHLADQKQYDAVEPFPVPPVGLDPASDLLDKVLPAVGASRPSRDAVDRRIVESVRDGTGTSRGGTTGPWPDLAADAPAPPPDSDHDGMPDSWEKARGLAPGDARDGAAVASNGYTNVENYLNELAGDPIPGR